MNKLKTTTKTTVTNNRTQEDVQRIYQHHAHILISKSCIETSIENIDNIDNIDSFENIENIENIDTGIESIENIKTIGNIDARQPK